jgi:hypothetical protein
VARTFSRRPHGQGNRTYPSSVSLAPPINDDDAAGDRRRSRIRAPHFGQSTRSRPAADFTLMTSPQRQVTRDMDCSLRSSFQFSVFSFQSGHDLDLGLRPSVTGN